MYAPVSVIIPCYKCKDTIARAIESINNQTLRPFEVILVDDFSQDSTLEFLYELKGNYHDDWLKVIALSNNKGPGTARNKGWDLASQKYIAFLDADDVWHVDKIQIQYSIMLADSLIDVTSHNTSNQRFDIHTNCAGKPYIESVHFKQMLFKNSIPTRSVMLKRSLNFRFEDGLYYAEDYRLWLDMLSEGLNVTHINFTLARSFKNDYGDNGLSSNLSSMESGVQSIFHDLYKDRKLSLMYYLIISIYSKFKFLTRVLLVQMVYMKTLIVDFTENRFK